MNKEEALRIDFPSSLLVALSDYIVRHHGEKPDKILMSREVATVMLPTTMLRFGEFPNKYAGIPLQIVDEKDDFIHLCEPRITWYQKRGEKIHK